MLVGACNLAGHCLPGHAGTPGQQDPAAGDSHPAGSQGQAQRRSDAKDGPRHQQEFELPRDPCNALLGRVHPRSSLLCGL